MSDFHCGHALGLTPPEYNPQYDDPYLQSLSQYREMLYNWTFSEVKKSPRPDVLVVNGDLIDGKGKHSGGTEQIEMDRLAQAEMAAKIIKNVNPKEVRMVYGTPYHSGRQEDYEDEVATILGCPKPESVLDINVNGFIFNFRHKIGRSSIPHGRATQLLKEQLWNQLWADRDEYPLADILIRSHVHYFIYAGGKDHLNVITPALQGYGSKYGERLITGTVDYGFMSFEVYNDQEFDWKPHILRMPRKQAEVL